MCKGTQKIRYKALFFVSHSLPYVTFAYKHKYYIKKNISKSRRIPPSPRHDTPHTPCGAWSVRCSRQR